MRPSPHAQALSTACALGVLASLACPAPVRAYEDQVTLGLEAGYARALANPDVPEHGPIVGIATSVGLNDSWSVRVRVDYAIHPGELPLHVGVVGAEALYLIDVLEWVPYFGLGLDGFGTVQDGAFGADLGAHAVVGIEWLPSWDWLLGLEIRPYVLPLSLDETGLDPVYLTATLRVSLIFDR